MTAALLAGNGLLQILGGDPARPVLSAAGICLVMT
jgi:hypothetical protein